MRPTEKAELLSLGWDCLEMSGRPFSSTFGGCKSLHLVWRSCCLGWRSTRHLSGRDRYGLYICFVSAYMVWPPPLHKPSTTSVKLDCYRRFETSSPHGEPWIPGSQLYSVSARLENCPKTQAPPYLYETRLPSLPQTMPES